MLKQKLIQNRNKFASFILISCVLTPSIAQAIPYKGLWTGTFVKTNGNLLCSSRGVLELAVDSIGNVQGSFNPGGGEFAGKVYINGKFQGTTNEGTNVRGQFMDDLGYGVYKNSAYNCSGRIKVER